jgi:anti-sigma-K factor RskA
VKDCEQLREHYHAYALGALEGEERAELDAHLARQCPVCTPEVERARWLVAQLAYLAPEAEPRPALREELLSRIPPAAPRPGGAIPVWVWVGAVAALLVLSLVLGNQLRVLQAELAELSLRAAKERSRLAQLEAVYQDYQRVLAILSAPGVRLVPLKAAPAALPELRAYWSERLGIVMTGEGLPSLAADRAYQLWIVPKKGQPLSAGVFRPATTGAVTHLSAAGARMADAAALAVTEEPATGSPQPTSSPLWVGPII